MAGVIPGQTIRSKDFQGALATIGLGHLCETGGADTPQSCWVDDSSIVLVTSTTVYVVNYETGRFESRAFTSDWADADGAYSAVVIGGYLYLLLNDAGTTPDTWRVYRYTIGSLSSGGTICTFSGATTLATTNDTLSMTTDGLGNFYFNYRAGNTANDYDIAKFSVSGTAFTFSSNFACGSTAGNTARIAAATVTRTTGSVTVTAGDIFGWNASTSILRRYNAAGTLQATGTQYVTTGVNSHIYYLNDFAMYASWEGNSESAAEIRFYGRIVIT